MSNTVVAGSTSQIKEYQESIISAVCSFYGRPYKQDDTARPTIRDTAVKFGLSPMKVRKILITGGLFRTEETDEIQQLYATGHTIKEIAGIKNISTASVNASLPYGKTMYGLDVRREDAIKVMQWRQDCIERPTGSPSDRLKAVFKQTLEKFSLTYPQCINVRLMAYNMDNGAKVIMHFLRKYNFIANIPKGIPLEQYISSVNGHAFMGGHDGSEPVDGVLLREDNPECEQTIIRLLASIYCRHYETDCGGFYLKHCKDGDALAQKIMKTGYAVWSDYITMHMTEAALGVECFCGGVGAYDLSKAIDEAVVSGSTASLAWVLLCLTGEDKEGMFKQTGTAYRKAGTGLFVFHDSLSVLNSQGFKIEITKEFIRELGKRILIELQEAQLQVLKTR